MCLSQLTLIDMIIYGALAASGHSAVRWSRVLRPLLLVNVTEGRQVHFDCTRGGANEQHRASFLKKSNKI